MIIQKDPIDYDTFFSVQSIGSILDHLAAA